MGIIINFVWIVLRMHSAVAWDKSISVTSRERERKWGEMGWAKTERKMDILNKVNEFRKYRGGSFAHEPNTSGSV